MSLLEPRNYFKPFAYPWAYEAYELMFHGMHWGKHEVVMLDDIKDWQFRLTDDECELLTQLFRFFTQADIDVAKGYAERYLKRFPHPEIRMMLLAFGAAEANHIDAYATLIETLGMPESEFQAFQENAAMREKHEYMFERESGTSIADILVDLAVFSAFGEGMQLFSSFAILMSFQRRGLMKGMTTIVEWSIRDESLHVESMIRLFHELVKEKPRAWNDETKKRIYDVCRRMVDLEDHFIDSAFGVSEIAGVTKEDSKAYIRYIADRRLLQLGLKPNYGQTENPFDWLDWIMNAPTHTNFFEQRSTEYGRGGTKGWENAYSFLARPAEQRLNPATWDAHQPIDVAGVLDAAAGTFTALAPVSESSQVSAPAAYCIYTKPDCPHCQRAKAALDERQIAYQAIELAEAERRSMIGALAGVGIAHATWPAIWKLGDSGAPERFIGGADALLLELNGS